MLMTVYNKLVRDRIPEIIRSKGKACKVRRIEDSEEIVELLEAKLIEEWDEYLEQRDVMELADILEVVFSLAERLGEKPEALMKLREAKARERGAFRDGIFLESVEDSVA